MKLMTKTLMALFALSFVATNASADILYETDFNTFSDGNIVGQDGWAAHSGAGSLPVQVSAGEVLLGHGTGSREDVNVGLGQTMGAGDVFRYSFDITVNGTDDATDVYFAHFRNDGTAFNTRAFVSAPNAAAGNFTFGLAENSALNAKFAQDFSFGQTYTLVGTYSYDLGVSTLEVLGFGFITSTDTDTLQPMSTFAFRQAGGNTSMVIDNLQIVAVPEPTFAGFGIIGLVGLIAARRRRAC